MSAYICDACEIDQYINCDSRSPHDLASCPHVFQDDEYPPNPFENQRHGMGLNAEYSKHQEIEIGKLESVGSKRRHNSIDIQTDWESTLRIGAHHRSMDHSNVQRTVEIPQGERENLKEETKASHSYDKNLLTTPTANRRSNKQLSKDRKQDKKKLLGEMFDTGSKNLVKRIIHSIFRTYKKYLLKKKLPFAREVQQEVQIEIGQIEYKELLQRLTDAVVTFKKVNGEWKRVVDKPSLLQKLMYEYKKSALLELDLPSLHSMVIVLPHIAQKVKYRNTEAKRKVTNEIPQKLYVQKIADLVDIIQGVILGIQQESE
ncbi:hypothetical protein FGO68_gene10220 [Halteria grandinella]|uniref:Uncharacterized protein n=1 Tax=Halteria grandinella TaxID=5974 RepID=A0A8J8NPE0_HALGN|nr:hypothetical protein FGO68_gene10220 [Halteria grandinella]